MKTRYLNTQRPSFLITITILGCLHHHVGYSAESELTTQELLNLSLEELLDITIVTGARQSLAEAPGIASVITAQDIEAIGARDLDEVLETVLGLHVARDTQGYRPIYTIRGIYSTRNPEVLMLINGIPTTSLYTGSRSFIWGGMPINMISRIEVIRGPGSAVYGADAFAGVINIITKTKKELNGTEVGIRAGRFESYEGWALHGNTWNGFDIAAGIEYRTTSGQDSMVQADAQTQYDKQFKTHASLAPGAVNTAVDSIDARVDVTKGVWQARVGYQGRRNVGLGAGITQALTPEGYATVDRTHADVTYHNAALADDWDVTAQLSYLDIAYQLHENRGFPRGAFGGAYPEGYWGDPGISERHTRFETFAFYSGIPTHLIRLGAGYFDAEQYEVTMTANFGINPATGQPLPPGSPLVDVSDTPYNFNRETGRKNTYLSLQDAWTITEHWDLTGSIRYDHYSDTGSTTNPRAALVWQPRENLTTKFLYGRAFRAPSFNELYNANNPSVLGNPNIQPETLNTWEFALHYRILPNLNIITNFFRYDIDNKIILIPSADRKTRFFQNVGRWKGQGLELETQWKASTTFDLRAHYSYTQVSDKSNDQDIGNYPRQSAYLRADWLWRPQWSLDLQAKWIADRKRSLNDPRPEIADYTDVNFTLRYKNSEKGPLGLAFSIRNLLDADTREPSLGPDAAGLIAIPDDLPLAKRHWFLELRYRF